MAIVQAGSAVAVPILDQAQELADTQSSFSNNDQLSQTLTVGTSGILTSVEVSVRRVYGNPGFVTLSILPTSDGTPGTTPLGAVTVDIFDFPIGVPAFFSFDFSAVGLLLAAGDVIAISLGTRDAIGDIRWAVSSNDPYADGQAFRRSVNALGPWESIRGFDYTFRTFVETVPEPAGASLMVIALVVYCLRRRARVAGGEASPSSACSARAPRLGRLGRGADV